MVEMLYLEKKQWVKDDHVCTIQNASEDIHIWVEDIGFFLAKPHNDWANTV